MASTPASPSLTWRPRWPPKCDFSRPSKAELASHEEVREDRYRSVDPEGLARSLPGIKAVGGPALVATMGRAERFPSAAHFRSFTGLAPKASETGNTDRKGQVMSKAGNALLRTTLIRAADWARKQDPQLARIYYVQMTERGKTHLAANCVVAAHLAERAWLVMRRGTPYVLRDIDGTVGDSRRGEDHHRRALQRHRRDPQTPPEQ